MWEWRVFLSTDYYSHVQYPERWHEIFDTIYIETRKDQYFDLDLPQYGLKLRNHGQDKISGLLELKLRVNEDTGYEDWLKEIENYVDINELYSQDLNSWLKKKLNELIDHRVADHVKTALNDLLHQIDEGKLNSVIIEKSRQKIKTSFSKIIPRFNTLKEHYSSTIGPVDDYVEIEFSKIEISDKIMFSIALEGPSKKILKFIVENMLMILNQDQIMGYPELIISLNQNSADKDAKSL